MRIHRIDFRLLLPLSVVNCFQNTNFSEDSQDFDIITHIHTVVNCFQNTNFSEDSQESFSLLIALISCELLSEY